MYTGKDILALGIEPGPHMKDMIDRCNEKGECSLEVIMDIIPKPKLQLDNGASKSLRINLDCKSDDDENFLNVTQTMQDVLCTPTIIQGVVMPDACPAGPMGTIPVGGVAVAKSAIHPGMHSADICCSMMVTNTGISVDNHAYINKAILEKEILWGILNSAESLTHFGPGGRRNGKRFTLSPRIYNAMKDNYFLNNIKTLQMAHEHLGTQGDGNHFMYVGVLDSTGEICIVTHHGSRGVGAQLYKSGMETASRMTRKIANGILKQNYWIPADSDEGKEYWDALQIVRKWTKANHNVLHQSICDRLEIKHKERFWNEHNFVFNDGDDLYYHAKGATPIHLPFLPDNEGHPQIVPLNMSQPILLIRGEKDEFNLGFAPHGAGREMSRTKHRKSMEGKSDEEIFREETKNIDARFYSNNIDITELPSAYKCADEVIRQIEYYRLANVVDKIRPYGCIMAGDWEKDKPWRKK